MSRALAARLEQLLDDAEDQLRLVRTFVALRRWGGAVEELRAVAHDLEVDAVALVIGARSEANVETNRSPMKPGTSGQRVPSSDPAAADEQGDRKRERHEGASLPSPRGTGTSGVVTGPARAGRVGRRGSEERGAPAPSAAAKLSDLQRTTG